MCEAVNGVQRCASASVTAALAERWDEPIIAWLPRGMQQMSRKAVELLHEGNGI
jgi:hypothetical protein